MQDFDIDSSQKFSPPLEEMLRHPKDVPQADNDIADTPPVPAVTSVPVAPVRPIETIKKAPMVAVAEIEEDESDYESGSEFGELNMVEPEPLDDNDFGLM